MQHSRQRHRIPDRQPDLFAAVRPPTSDPMPGWTSLPDRTRQAVTGLMTRLLIGHVASATAQQGSDAIER